MFADFGSLFVESGFEDVVESRWFVCDDGVDDECVDDIEPEIKKRKKKITNHSIEEIHEIVELRGGVCLTKEYTNTETRLKIICEKGHEWNPVARSLFRGWWCQPCNSTSKRLPNGLAEAQEIALKHSGICLSDEYLDSRNHKLLFRCADGHEFPAALRTLKGPKGGWCPHCKKTVRESICRNVFEQLYGVSFPSTRPYWLKVGRGRRELDGYNETLKLAFEYQGKQHFLPTLFMDNDIGKLEIQKLRDEHKRQKCIEEGVILIEIPYNVRTPQIIDFIVSELLKSGAPPMVSDPAAITISFVHEDHQLKKLRDKAEARGGKCLSTQWLGGDVKYAFVCSQGHSFHRSAHTIMSGSHPKWCNICREDELETERHATALAKLASHAISKGGSLLSTTYNGANEEIEMHCRRHGPFTGFAKSFLHKSTWCKKCGRNSHSEKLMLKNGLEQFNAKLTPEKVELRETEYFGVTYIYTCFCSRSHTFKRSGAGLKKNGTCPRCNRIKRKQAFAERENQQHKIDKG